MVTVAVEVLIEDSQDLVAGTTRMSGSRNQAQTACSRIAAGCLTLSFL